VSAVAAGRLVEAVRAVLAGQPLVEVAGWHALSPAQLEAVVALWTATPITAIQATTGACWHSLRVTVTNRNRAEQALAVTVAPLLDRLCAGRASAGWWAQRDRVHWRICLHNPDLAAAEDLIRTLRAGDVAAATRPELDVPDGVGGPLATAIVFGLRIVDSRALLRLATPPGPSPGRGDLSVVLVDALLSGARLNPPARAALFGRLAVGHDAEPAHARRVADALRAVLDHPSPGLTGRAAPWAAAYTAAGRQLADAAALGLLARPLEQLLAGIVAGQWARLGLPASAQAALAHAAHHLYT
jgi:hypothetical protein